jgi:HEAT repeats/Putative zinc-finger
MSCEEGARCLTGYLDATLDPASRRHFEAHLQNCANCREELNLWMRLDELPSPAPSPALRRHFEAALAAESPRSSPNIALPWYALAAAAMVLVATGWLLGNRQTSAPPPSELSALRQEVGSLRSMVALSLLTQESASSRLQGISYAGRLKQDSPDVLGALVSALRYDSNVNVRLAAFDALRAYRAVPSVRHSLVAALATEESPLMQITLIDAVADLGDRDSIQPLLRLRATTTEDQSVRERAARALDQMKSKGIQWE